MMTYGAEARENQIAIALGRCAASAKQAGSGHWEFALANGKVLGVSARLVEDWLLLDSPLTDRIGPGDWWRLLRLNRTLHGLSKFVLMPDGQSVHLLADIPLPGADDTDGDSERMSDGVLTTRLVETCGGLKAAYRNFLGEKVSEYPTSASPVNPEGPVNNRVAQLRQLCGDAGWPFIERSAGTLMVDLDVRGGYYQAAVEQRFDGVEVAVEIAQSEALGETSRRALSLLLLATGAIVRLARPSIEEHEYQAAMRFDVRFTTMPAAVELAHAFASLSVACAMSGREARALQDDAIARDYLAIVGTQESLPAPSSCAD